MLTENGKGKNRSRLTWIKSPKIEEKRRKRRRKGTATHLQKKMCFLFDHLLCEFATISFKPTESNFFFYQELLREQKGHRVDQAVCLFGPGTAAEVSGQSWFSCLKPGKHILQMPRYLQCDIGLGCSVLSAAAI